VQLQRSLTQRFDQFPIILKERAVIASLCNTLGTTTKSLISCLQWYFAVTPTS
jgi:hypothetical protein